MKNVSLVPVFAASGSANVILLVLLVILVYKNLKLGQKEFYRTFILLFISVAYLIRIAEFIYLPLSMPHEKYNRPLISCKFDNVTSFVAYAPIAFHGLGGLAYACRWIHYYLLATSATWEDQNRIKRLVKANRIEFVALTAINILSIIFITSSSIFSHICVIFQIVFYFMVALVVLIVVSMFLAKLKIYLYHVYAQKHITIRVYAYLLSFWLLFRIASLALDTYITWNNEWVKGEPDFNNDLANRINDVILLAFYFIELTPSLVIIVVLWKSNNELKMKQEVVFQNTSISNPENTNSFPKTDSVEKLLDDYSSSGEGANENYDSYKSNKKARYNSETQKKRSTKTRDENSLLSDKSPLVNPQATLTYY